MRKSVVVVFFLIVGSVFAGNRRPVKVEGCEYVVLASRSVEQEQAWKEVVEVLRELHAAEVVYYVKEPREALEELRRIHPRYVAG